MADQSSAERAASTAYSAAVGQLLAAAAELDRRGLLSASGHGNISVRLPDSDELIYSGAPDLRSIAADQVVHARLDATVLAGQLRPLAEAALQMHLGVYAVRPDCASVIHTHSAHATGYAVAGQPIDCWAEPLALFGITEAIPVVGYARRGSVEAVEAIQQHLTPDRRALLLGNHGVLVLGSSAAEAVQVLSLVEEAAQLGVIATALGGPVPIPPELRR